MKKTLWARVLGLLGLVLLLSSVVTALFGQTTLLLGKLALGLAGIAAGVALGAPGGLRRFFTGRAAAYGLLTAASGLALVVLLGAANWAALRRPRTWDLTKGKVFTLSEETRRTVAGLRRDVEVLAFYGQGDEAYPRVSDLLRRYAALSPRLTWRFVDPYRSPEAVRKYGITGEGPRVVLLAGAEEQRARFPDEEGLTNALVRLTRSGSKVLYLTTGHGEPEARAEGERGYGLAVKALEAEAYQVAPLPLLERGEVPADAAAVLVTGPRKAFLPAELAALRRHLAAGGHLGIFVEPEVRAGLDPLLEDCGVALDDDMVVDPSPAAQLYTGSPVTPMLKPSAAHPVTRDLAQTALAFPTARSLAALTAGKVTAAPLVLTGKDAWGETDVAGIFTRGARYDEGEKVGPLPVALAAQLPPPPPPAGADPAAGPARAEGGRCVVVGDADFFANGYQHLLGNLDFFQSAVGWLAEQEDRIAIRPRLREGSRLVLSAAQVSGLKFLTIDALPVALLGAGLAIWLVRRSR